MTERFRSSGLDHLYGPRLADDDDFLNAALLMLDSLEESSSDGDVAPLDLAYEEPLLAQAEPSGFDLSRLQAFEPLVFEPMKPRRVNKRREEISRLKVEAQHLEKKLAVMQIRQQKPPVVEHRPRQALGDAWQSMATRQLDQRRRVEAENRRLKDLVNEQKRTTRALRRLIATHATARVWEPFRPPPPPPSWPFGASSLFSAAEDRHIFDSLTSSLLQMQAQTSAIMADPRMATSDFRDIKTDIHGAGSLVVQLLESRFVPFSVPYTGSALWQNLSHQYEMKTTKWHRTDEDVLQAQIMAYMDVGGFKGHAQAKMALRTIEEPDRIVFTRCALFQKIEGVCKNQFMRLPMRHYLWMVAEKPHTTDSIMASDAITQIQTCSISIPQIDTPHDLERAVLVDTCINLTNDRLDQVNTGIDKLLLQHSHDRVDHRAIVAL